MKISCWPSSADTLNSAVAAEFSNELQLNRRLNSIDKSSPALQPGASPSQLRTGTPPWYRPLRFRQNRRVLSLPQAPPRGVLPFLSRTRVLFFSPHSATDFSVKASFYSRIEPPPDAQVVADSIHAGTPLQRPQRSEWSLDSVWTIFADAVEASLLAASGEAQMPLDPARSIFSSFFDLLQCTQVRWMKQFEEKIL